MNKAVIVAAGVSARMGDLARDTPKCFLTIAGKPLISYSLACLHTYGIDNIAFVVGHQREQFPAHLGDEYTYIYDPLHMGNMLSFWFAKDFVKGEDFLYLHADLLYHPVILSQVIDADAPIVLSVEQTDCDSEMMKVKVEGSDLVESSKDIPIEEAFGEWTGIAKFTSHGFNEYLVEVEKLLVEQQFRVYDTAAMSRLANRLPGIIQVATFRALPFIEIDYPEDLTRAKTEIYPRLKTAYENITLPT